MILDVWWNACDRFLVTTQVCSKSPTEPVRLRDDTTYDHHGKVQHIEARLLQTRESAGTLLFIVKMRTFMMM